MSFFADNKTEEQSLKSITIQWSKKMSAKQSKIFNFFQRKPSSSSPISPSVPKVNSSNGEEKSIDRFKPNAAGDVRRENVKTVPSFNAAASQKRIVQNLDLKENFEDDFPDPDELDKVCEEAETSMKRDHEDKQEESRPPKKRKRIVSYQQN